MPATDLAGVGEQFGETGEISGGAHDHAAAGPAGDVSADVGREAHFRRSARGGSGGECGQGGDHLLGVSAHSKHLAILPVYHQNAVSMNRQVAKLSIR